MVTKLNLVLLSRGMVGINPPSGTKTTTKKGTNPPSRISGRLLTLFRKVNFQLQEDDSDNFDLDLETFEELNAQFVSTFKVNYFSSIKAYSP